MRSTLQLVEARLRRKQLRQIASVSHHGDNYGRPSPVVENDRMLSNIEQLDGFVGDARSEFSTAPLRVRADSLEGLEEVVLDDFGAVRVAHLHGNEMHDLIYGDLEQ